MPEHREHSSPKKKFDKEALSYRDQIQLLESRGLIIDNPQEAEHYLKHLNYYRLSAYWRPFELDRRKHSFKDGTRFQQVIDLYMFDQELRLLFLKYIDYIEVSVRSRWAYEVGMAHGPHAHLNPQIFDNYFFVNCKKLIDLVDRSKEEFIRHFDEKYREALPPVWVACEVMSLSDLSKWYKSLSIAETRRSIASYYELPDILMSNWLYILCYVRNIAAHHARLWNKASFNPKLPTSKGLKKFEKLDKIKDKFIYPGNNKEEGDKSRKIYNIFWILVYFMDSIEPNHRLSEHLKSLVDTYEVPISSMGFLDGWTDFVI